MRAINRAQFLHWCERHGISLDATYPSYLRHTCKPQFGNIWIYDGYKPCPPDPLAEVLLKAIGFSQSIYLWPRSPNLTAIFANEESPLLEFVSRHLGPELATDGAVEFAPADSTSLMVLLTATLIYAWSTHMDLFLISEDA